MKLPTIRVWLLGCGLVLCASIQAMGEPMLRERLFQKKSISARVNPQQHAPLTSIPFASRERRFTAQSTSPLRKQRARALFEEIMTLHTAMETDKVRAKLKKLVMDFPEVEKDSAYTKFAGEIGVIGKEAGDLQVTMWFQGETTFAAAGLTLVVFWESWCPHCQDEMPKIQQLFTRFQERGLQVIGLTKISSTATMTSVIAFIAENDLTFSIAKETGTMSDRFGVVRVPAAAIVKGGKVIWRGNPVRLSDQTIEKALLD